MCRRGAVGFDAAGPALFGVLVWIGVNFNGVAPGEFGERISPGAVDAASFALQAEVGMHGKGKIHDSRIFGQYKGIASGRERDNFSGKENAFEFRHQVMGGVGAVVPIDKIVQPARAAVFVLCVSRAMRQCQFRPGGAWQGFECGVRSVDPCGGHRCAEPDSHCVWAGR